MPFSVIDKGSKYFTAKTYTGTGSTQSITGLEFAPKFTWIKDRTNGSANHNLFDVLRIWSGDSLPARLYSNTTDAEESTTYLGASNLTAFNSDGFTLGSGGNTNTNTNSYVSWNWRGSDSSAVSNTAGTISSTVSANTTSGFSIVSYTGNATAGATVGHGLGVAPKMIIIKNRSAATEWLTYHASIGTGKYLALQSTAAQAGSVTIWGTSASTFTLSQNYSDYNGNGNSHIAYCFADVKGFSKFGSYTGNGASGNGTFTYLGFKPAFVMIKEISGTDGWGMFDNKRVTYNYVNTHVQAQSTSADITNTADAVDFLSNGFKVATGTSSANFINESGASYIYMAFAESPFTSSKGIPTTAR
jgi:hypothetical protein